MAWRVVGVVATVATLSGLAASGAPSVGAPQPAGAAATVTIHGRDGSFGALGDAVPSGQSLVRRAVPGWGFPAGRQAYRTALTNDGTVLIAGRDHGVSFLPPTRSTGAELVIGAYQPDTNGYHNVRVQTTAGRDRVVDRGGRPAGPSVVDLEPIAGGAAVAYTAWPTDANVDTATEGRWPVFGVLSKVDGQWRAAGQWTGDELRAASTAVGARACPEQPRPPGRGECRGLSEMAAVPRSHDLIVAQRAGLPGTHNGGLAALRVTGPDAAGRFSVRVVGHYLYPRIKQPGKAEFFDIVPVSVQADPTSTLGDERFAVSFDVVNGAARDNPPVIQEFSYDARTGTIQPVSPPLIPGDRTGDGKRFNGFTTMLYDSRGNLWAARVNGLAGGKLALYSDGPKCRHEPGRALDSYVTGGVWGQACRPDYDILQAQSQPVVLGMVEDPVSHDIVLLLFDGILLPIRPSGSGPDMTFRIGNLVDLGRKLLPSAEGDFPDHRLGAIDEHHRLWVSRMQGREQVVEVPALDQWLYAVDVGDLFDPAPVELPATPGWSVIVQAERTTTMSTTRRPGAWATVDVDSDAYVGLCPDTVPGIDCASDATPGAGFALADDSRFGHLDGTVEYRVSVPRAGSYRIGYRVATFAVTTGARIELAAGERTYVTPVSTGGGWRTIWHDVPVTLHAGVQHLRLSVPPRAGGWYLNSITLRRV
jgi:hypothetical protein